MLNISTNTIYHTLNQFLKIATNNNHASTN